MALQQSSDSRAVALVATSGAADPSGALSEVPAVTIVAQDGTAMPAGTAAAPVNTQPPFSRTDYATANFTPATGYSAGHSMGGLITVETGRPSTTLRLTNAGLVVPMESNGTPGSTLVLVVFGSEPSGTYTDAAAPTWTATDTDLIRRAPTFAWVYGIASGTLATYATQTTAWPLDVTTDAEGKLYFVVLVNATTAWTTPGSARFTVDYLY